MSILILDKPKHTIQGLLTDYFQDYLKSSKRKLWIDDHILKTVNQIISCRTPKLGMYVVGCHCCGTVNTIPRSCKNRFCNSCGTSDTMNWVNRISESIADIKHHHITFTLPLDLRIICQRNKKLFYNLLFRHSQLSIKKAFIEKGYPSPGMISVLHTNGSDLKYHPHIHMIVSSGGLDSEGVFVELDQDYIFPQRYLANLYRDSFMKELRYKIEKGEVRLPSSWSLGNKQAIYLNTAGSKQWIVNIEDPLMGAEKIIAYVGRYTKKSCISERRILSVTSTRVVISFKDYKNSKRGEKPVDGVKKFGLIEFMDRLLQHVPLKGFKVVRYYGLYCGSNKDRIPPEKKMKEVSYDQNLEEVDLSTIEQATILYDFRKSMILKTGVDPCYCYDCQEEMSLLYVHFIDHNGNEKKKYYDNVFTENSS